jgi:hypothetical protein
MQAYLRDFESTAAGQPLFNKHDTLNAYPTIQQTSFSPQRVVTQAAASTYNQLFVVLQSLESYKTAQSNNVVT